MIHAIFEGLFLSLCALLIPTQAILIRSEVRYQGDLPQSLLHSPAHHLI